MWSLFNSEIQNNLRLIRAIPFIDDSIVIEGVPSYDKEFAPLDDEWEEYCQLNREAFIKKLNAALEQKRLKRM